MSQSAPLVLRYWLLRVTAATRAGKIIKDVMSSGELGVVQKVPSDWIVTESDLEVLSSNCPPEYVETKPEDIVVWVDPLDGTSEYTQGLLDHVTVLIGIAVNGRADTMGSHRFRSWRFSASRTPADKFIVTTTRSHSDGIVVKALEALKPDEIVRVGGAGHKVLLLLEGRAHAYVFASKGCKKWDTCAPEAILEALGGKLTDIHGNNYGYGKDVQYPDAQGIFATAKGVDHALLVSKIPQELLDAFPY
ncbi:hypothetical protein NQ314_019247 [Rhamnusium bicolor]|uniref:3'(2'),5'-bisphosphate nucleotidase 1 n=1 Tax=Rhamnusium bicolor TaxID=1586634 RepID=A0AAV8WPH8_9CUCU|nr:hypothetical protein NQ314_019247 [Rhamnusium bicolor]